MKKFIILASVFLLVLGLVSTSSAVPLVNGGFDDTTGISLADVCRIWKRRLLASAVSPIFHRPNIEVVIFS